MGVLQHSRLRHRATALLALGLRSYLAYVWLRFGWGKIEAGWLTSNLIEPLIDVVANGYTNAWLPIYQPLARAALALGLDRALGIAFPLAEVAIAAALITGLSLRRAVITAILINLNLILSGLSPWQFDGRIILLQLIVLALGTSASRYGWSSLVSSIRRLRAPKYAPGQPRAHVVIVGAGFAGLRAARELRHAPIDVTVIDRTNHHLFQPLLYQVATSIVSPSDIAVPTRALLRSQANATTLMARVTNIHPETRVIELEGGRRTLSYDFLILAAGARHSYFGNESWEAHAPGLKSLDDALEIRRRFLLAFERAEMTDDPRTRAMEQTIVVVGGGPTGVELAGAIPEMVQRTLVHDFRRADTRRTRIVLLERGPRLLPALDPELSARAESDLRALGVEIRTNAVVTDVTGDAVHLGPERIPTKTVLWAAGNVANPLGRLLSSPVDHAGRVCVAPDLSLPDHPEIFVVGDMAAVSTRGVAVPAVATAAMQMGRLAAHNLLASIRGRARTPFVYKDKGSLAIINRRAAVAQIGRLRIRGSLASALWGLVHLLHLVNRRSRLRVLAEWVYAHVTHDRGYRLITGTTSARETTRASLSHRIDHDAARATARRGA